MKSNMMTPERVAEIRADLKSCQYWLRENGRLSIIAIEELLAALTETLAALDAARADLQKARRACERLTKERDKAVELAGAGNTIWRQMQKRGVPDIRPGGDPAKWAENLRRLLEHARAEGYREGLNTAAKVCETHPGGGLCNHDSHWGPEYARRIRALTTCPAPDNSPAEQAAPLERDAESTFNNVQDSVQDDPLDAAAKACAEELFGIGNADNVGGVVNIIRRHLEPFHSRIQVLDAKIVGYEARLDIAAKDHAAEVDELKRRLVEVLDDQEARRFDFEQQLAEARAEVAEARRWNAEINVERLIQIDENQTLLQRAVRAEQERDVLAAALRELVDICKDPPERPMLLVAGNAFRLTDELPATWAALQLPCMSQQEARDAG